MMEAVNEELRAEFRRIFDPLWRRYAEIGEEKLRGLLRDAKDGDELASGLTVSRSATDSFTAIYRTNIQSLFKGPAAFVRAEVRIGRTIVFNGDVPDPDVQEVEAFMAEFGFRQDGVYEASVGLGYDSRAPRYAVGRGVLKTQAGLNFDVFLAGLGDRGLVVSLGAGLPAPIPLGPSGLLLVGVSGTFASDFVPRIEGETPTPQAYAKWARSRAQSIDAWLPVDSPEVLEEQRHKTAFGIGLGCDMVWLDQGHLIRFKDIGFFVLSIGPTVYFEGGMTVLDGSKPSLQAICLVDLKGPSFLASASGGLSLPDADWEIVKVEGHVETFLSPSDPRKSYFHLGTPAEPLRGRILKDLLEASTYATIDFADGLRLAHGARVHIERSLDFLGASLSYLLGIGYAGAIGIDWPPQLFVSASIALGGRACLWKCVGLSLEGTVLLAVAKPLNFALYGEVRIELPWPLGAIHLGPAALAPKMDSDEAKKLESPLRLKGQMPTIDDDAPHDMTLGDLSGIHEPSGRQWKLGEEGHAPVWPDVALVIPFSRRPSDASGTVIAAAQEMPVEEQGFSTRHAFKRLTLTKLLPDGSEAVVPDTRAAWAAGPVTSGTSLLLYPSNNPFAWLLPHEQTDRTSTTSPGRRLEQDFGRGEREMIGGLEVGGAERRFGFLGARAAPGSPLDIHPGRPGSTRALFSHRIAFHFYRADGSPQMVSGIRLTVVGPADAARTGVQAEGGILAATPVLVVPAEADGSAPISSIDLAAPDGSPFDQLVLRSSGRYEFPIAVLRVSVDTLPEVSTNNAVRTILQPGRYRLDVEVESVAYRGSDLKAGPRGWSFARAFNVTFPDQLRPYIRATTIGDTRLFLKPAEAWNPTPHGIGFPIYRAYAGVVRFAVSYLSSIFPELIVERSDLPSEVVQPTTDAVGSSDLNARDQGFLRLTGAGAPPTQQLVLAPPGERAAAGLHYLDIRFRNPLKPGNAPEKLDGWSFQVSRFTGFSEHVRVADLSAAYSPQGLRAPPPLPGPLPGDPTGATPDPGVPEAWRLPTELDALLRGSGGSGLDVTAGLRFLQFAKRCNCRFGGEGPDLLTLPIPPDDSRLDFVLDTVGRSLALLLRTPEPLDWRRVSGTLARHSADARDGMWTGLTELAILPAPDASAAFIVASAEGRGVRLPRGWLHLVLTYARRADALPTLIRAVGEPDTDEQFALTFYQPFGPSLP